MGMETVFSLFYLWVTLQQPFDLEEAGGWNLKKMFSWEN